MLRISVSLLLCSATKLHLDGTQPDPELEHSYLKMLSEKVNKELAINQTNSDSIANPDLKWVRKDLFGSRDNQT